MGKENKQDMAEKQREKADLWKKMTDENAARAEREWKREEEAANRAARELQEKKKKKRRKIRIVMLLILVIAAAGIFGGLRYQQYQKEKASQEADVLALAEGEELVYGKITKAVGNDITVTLLDVKENTETTETDNEKAEGGNGQGDAPGGGFQGEGMQNAAGTQVTVDVQGITAVQGTAGVQGPADIQNGQAQSVTPQNSLQYTETSQTKEYEVPVGTEVTTRLGATTSFSRLSTGNIIGIVVQSGTDNILRIKIVE